MAQEIIGSYEARAAGITSLRNEVTAQRQATQAELRELDKAHQAMARQQCADLAKGRSELAGSVASQLKELEDSHTAMSRELKADLAKSVADRKDAVSHQLKELDDSHTAMSKKLKTDLAKSVADRKHEVGVILKGFNAELKEVRSELAGGRDEWQKMTATMQYKRGDVTVAMKPQVEGAAEITPETAALRQQVFEYLANHPDGARMTELEQEFGVARLQMAKVVRSFMDENKVAKRDLLYFAVQKEGLLNHYT